MALSRRLRYEILRRDNHQCRYCGAAAPDAKLTVDHVIPVSLGGSDEPGNLVTACQQCNAGKAASNPDAPIVADVKDDAIRWARAIEVVSNARMADREARDWYVDRFEAAWTRWTYPTYRRPDKPSTEVVEAWNEVAGDLAKFVIPTAYDAGTLYLRAKSLKRATQAQRREDDLLGELYRFDVYSLEVLDPYSPGPTITIRNHLPRPSGWKASIWNFYASGLAIEEVEDAVEISCSARNVSMDHVFRYFCGVCWRKIEEIREAAGDVWATLEEG